METFPASMHSYSYCSVWRREKQLLPLMQRIAFQSVTMYKHYSDTALYFMFIWHSLCVCHFLKLPYFRIRVTVIIRNVSSWHLLRCYCCSQCWCNQSLQPIVNAFYVADSDRHSVNVTSFETSPRVTYIYVSPVPACSATVHSITFSDCPMTYIYSSSPGTAIRLPLMCSEAIQIRVTTRIQAALPSNMIPFHRSPDHICPTLSN